MSKVTGSKITSALLRMTLACGMMLSGGAALAQDRTVSLAAPEALV